MLLSFCFGKVWKNVLNVPNQLSQTDWGFNRYRMMYDNLLRGDKRQQTVCRYYSCIDHCDIGILVMHTEAKKLFSYFTGA